MSNLLNLIKAGFKILRTEGIREFVESAMFYLYTRSFMHKLKNIGTADKLEELFNIPFSQFHQLFKPQQIKWEILKLLELLKESPPKYVLEIGTAEGGTLFYFTRIAAEDANLISVDPFYRFGTTNVGEIRIALYKSFARKEQNIHIIRANSHEQETLDRVKELLGANKLDFLFIDGDHTYDGVKSDFEMYSPLVGEGGIVAFHDINGKRSVVIGVRNFWNEIKPNFKHEEFVEDQAQPGGGIGVLKF